jgi:vacuolar protein-sorting-associated protein 4
MSESHLSQAVAALEKGKSLEEKQDLSGAFDSYLIGCDLLKKEISSPQGKSKVSKEEMKKLFEEYLKKAEDVQKKIKAKGLKKENSNSAGVGDEKKKEQDEKEEDPEVKKLQGALANAIVTETPNVKWEDVAGLDTAKSLLKEAVLLPIKVKTFNLFFILMY